MSVGRIRKIAAIALLPAIRRVPSGVPMEGGSGRIFFFSFLPVLLSPLLKAILGVQREPARRSQTWQPFHASLCLSVSVSQLSLSLFLRTSE